MSLLEIKVATSPEIPRYRPLTRLQRVARFFRLPVKRTMAVFYLSTQNTYIVAPESLPEFLQTIDKLGFRSAEPLKVVK